MTRAYYNEIDPYAAEWIRNLIKAGHITDGEVDTRSIVDVRPEDLRGFDRCHFFAGIAVWDYALGLAGWPEDRAVWTGSCPCQPFSAAGKRGGTADERHLWPAFFHLIRECRPATVLGEQVASKDGLGWLDLVHSDLEGEGYAVGAADLCAAGVGAPHIRQRLWFVAHASGERRAEQPVRLRPEATGRISSDLPETLRSGSSGGDGRQRSDAGDARLVAHAAGSRRGGREDAGADRGHPRTLQGGGQGLAGVLEPQRGGALSLVVDSSSQGSRRHAGAVLGAQGAGAGERGGVGRESDELVASGAARLVVDANDARLEGQQFGRDGSDQRSLGSAGVAGFWSDADWIPCRDGKARPVESGAFPLAPRSPNHMGRLRAYGNAICAPVAATFIASVLDVGAL